MQTRLYADDVFKFLFELNEVLISKVEVIGLIVVIVCIAIVFARFNKKEVNSKAYVLLLAMFILLFIYDDFKISGREVFFDNFIESNRNVTYKKSYSNEFIDNFSYSSKINRKSINSSKPDNIYVFFVESWSNYQSLEFGGAFDWTPRLDQLARSNIKLSNFYANGFSTEMGLYATLIGIQPILYKQNVALDGGMGLLTLNNRNSQVKKIKEFGYRTSFITSGNTDFLQKKDWLELIGFENIIGSESFSKNTPRYLFNSVSDKVLFDYFKSWDIENSDISKFVVIENVSTHAPYYIPSDNGVVRSEEKAFRYTDEELANLLIKLSDSSDNNLIIVISDHRAMSPLTRDEINRDGIFASSKVPGFVIWNKYNKNIEKNFQQSDILNSILSLLSGEVVYSDIQGSLFPLVTPSPAKCITYQRGDNRSLVSVKCEDESFLVRSNGDNTSTINEVKSLPVDVVNYLRLYQSN
ncbi:LTA synthase family protein [Vibrio ezurae]|uniref:Sulfatase N-terminal domain-containing protein n=1 Tax=Vibrio ezurae NBRC 102218 TaxID=1219080 RepID=U3CB86_9VIBR|nr:LTA synthase family protein [Vibrio ezurae]GAD78589.1 hypothetical protein VEZ01S_04_00360 [Vibrio ezurae NBRC 102218]